MKDLFVDNCAAKNFANPLDPEYKALVRWLMDEEGALVVSNKLLGEYGRTSGGCAGATNIWIVVKRLTDTGRLVKIQNCQLRAFVIPKRISRRLQSNREDHVHIKTVLLSHRKYALTLDTKLCRDLKWYPGYSALAATRPQDIPYRV